MLERFDETDCKCGLPVTVEASPEGELVRYADAQRALDALQAQLRHMTKERDIQKEVADNQAWHVRDLKAQLRQDEQRAIRDCCEKPHDCKWGGLGGCGYEGRKHELRQVAPPHGGTP